jgi:hypothetical protein
VAPRPVRQIQSLAERGVLPVGDRGTREARNAGPPGRPMGSRWGGRSGFPSRACLTGMQIAYLAVTILAAFANGYAAVLNFVRAKSVKVVACEVRVSQKWMILPARERPIARTLTALNHMVRPRSAGGVAAGGLALRAARCPVVPRPPARTGARPAGRARPPTWRPGRGGGDREPVPLRSGVPLSSGPGRRCA